MKSLDIEKTKKMLQTLRSVPDSEKWFSIPKISDNLIEQVYNTAELIQTSNYATQFLLHLARFSFWNAISSDRFSPPDLFIPRPEFRLVQRSSLMMMHQTKDKGVVDQWGLLFNSKKKFRQFFTNTVLKYLEKDELIILIKGKGKSIWDKVLLTTKGWLVAVVLEFNQSENLNPICRKETFLNTNLFRQVYMTHNPVDDSPIFRLTRGAELAKLKEVLDKNEDLIVLSSHNDGSSMLLKTISTICKKHLLFYVDTSLLAHPLDSDIREIFLSMIDMANIKLDHKEALYSAFSPKPEEGLISWFRNVFDRLHRTQIWDTVRIILDHADLVFLHKELFNDQIATLLENLLKGKLNVSTIVSLKQLPASHPVDTVTFSLPPIPIKEIIEALIFERKRHCLKSEFLCRNIQTEPDETIISSALFQTEMAIGRAIPFNELLFFAERVVELQKPLDKMHLGIDFITSRSVLKNMLKKPEVLQFLEQILVAYSSLYNHVNIQFLSPRWFYRAYVKLDIDLDPKLVKQFHFDHFFTKLDGYIKVNSDPTLRAILQMMTEVSFSDEEQTLLKSMELFNQTFKSWKGSLSVHNVPSKEDLEKFLNKFQGILLTPAKLTNLNLDHLSIGVTLAIFTGLAPPDPVVELVSPYLVETMVELLSILQSAKMPLHEKRHLLEEFSLNLMLATKTSQKLKELAGGMTECFLHLPSTFAMDLFEQAILWRITWKEKMLLLVDFLLTHESELVIPLRKQINLSLPLKASMGQNPDEINDNFLLLFIQRLLEKHWDHHLLVRTVDDLLLGLLDVNEEVLQPFLEYVRLKAPILYPLLDLLYPSDPRKRLFGYNEFFLTPLFLIAFAGGSSELRKLLEQKPPVIGGIDELFSTLLDVYLSFREESYAGLLFSELEETFFQGHALRNFFENKKVGILLIGEYAYAYGFEIPRLWNLSIVGKPYKSLLLDQLHEEWVDSSHSSYSRLSQFIRKMYSEVLRDLPMERRIDELEEFLSRSVSEFQYFDKAFNIASASLIPNTYNNLIKFCDLLLDISESWPSPMILNAVGFILEKMHLFEEFPDEILSSLNRWGGGTT